jgi:hypothetical protein
LRGFEEVKLAVGASATVTMSLSAREIRRSFLFLDQRLIDLVLVSNIWNVVSQALVEDFKFFSEKFGEKCPSFFTLFFTEKASEKIKTFSALFGLFQIFHLKNKKVVKTF